jgi:hypothetical protein
MTPASTSKRCIEKIHTAFFIKLFAKVLQRAYIKITRSHHSTPTILTMRENHVSRALCPENTKKPHQLDTGNYHIPQATL